MVEEYGKRFDFHVHLLGKLEYLILFLMLVVVLVPLKPMVVAAVAFCGAGAGGVLRGLRGSNAKEVQDDHP